jgi:hypothetical protein
LGESIRRLGRPAAVALCLFACACGDKQEKELTSARSWSASALLVGAMWVREEVPSPFASDTLKKAAEALKKGPLPAAAAPVEELREAVERGDRDAARRLLGALSPG